MEYLDFFHDLKKFIVNNKLDSNSHIEGASISEIEQAIAKPVDKIPKAYVDFLKVFGNNLSEEALRLDFILDSRAYDNETAVEINTTIANNADNLIIAVDAGTFIYYINRKNHNPKVYWCSDNGEFKTVSELFTAFIRECAFEQAELRRSGGEGIGVQGVYWGGRGEESRSLFVESQKMRSDYVLQIESRELESGIISLADYQTEWKLFFEHSSLYANNTGYYAKWGKPYVFEGESIIRQLFS